MTGKSFEYICANPGRVDFRNSSVRNFSLHVDACTRTGKKPFRRLPRRLHSDFHASDTNDTELSHAANGNARIDSDDNTSARKKEKGKEGRGSNIFSPDYLRAFSQMQHAAAT